MESKVLESIISQGPWAALFVFLLFYVLKDAKEREGKYQEVVAKLSDIINSDMKEIKECLKDFLCIKKGGE